MAGDELDTTVGPDAGAAAGDSAAADAATPAAQGGDGAGTGNEVDEAQQARDEYVAQIAAAAAMKAVQEMMREAPAGQPAPAAGTPPTPAPSGMSELEAERLAIINEQQALAAAIQREGFTGELLYRHNELTSRKAEFVGRVNLLAMKQQETEREVARRGSEPEWQAFAAQHPGVPMDILRDAFKARSASAAPAAPKPGTPAARPKPVDVSAGGERGAETPKKPTMTYQQAADMKAKMRAEGRHDEAAKLDRQIRSRDVLLKG